MTPADLGKRVREKLNAEIDWSAAAQAQRWAWPKQRRSRPQDHLADLPKQPAPLPAGVIPRATPSRHELAILRRAALGFIIVTQREHQVRYLFEDGTEIPNDRGGRLDHRGFERLKMFLV